MSGTSDATPAPGPAPGLTTGAVARRLGVSPTTLRSWDRRYGLGPAAREDGRHRRWTPADIAMLAEMCRLTASGVPPAEAARAARAGAHADPAGYGHPVASAVPPGDAAPPTSGPPTGGGAAPASSTPVDGTYAPDAAVQDNSPASPASSVADASGAAALTAGASQTGGSAIPGTAAEANQPISPGSSAAGVSGGAAPMGGNRPASGTAAPGAVEAANRPTPPGSSTTGTSGTVTPTAGNPPPSSTATPGAALRANQPDLPGSSAVDAFAADSKAAGKPPTAAGDPVADGGPAPGAPGATVPVPGPAAGAPGTPPQPDALPSPGTPTTHATSPHPGEEARRELRGLARAAVRLDGPALDALLGDFVGRHGLVAAWEEVMVPALHAVGRKWEASGDRYVEVEHLLSWHVSTALRRALPAGGAPMPATAPGAPPVLLACVPAEQHTLPLEALAAGLTARGLPVRMLGAAVPPEALDAAVRRTGPAAVVLWSQARSTASHALARHVAGTAFGVRGARTRPLVALAGPGWAGRAPGPGLARPTSLHEALALLTALYP